MHTTGHGKLIAVPVLFAAVVACIGAVSRIKVYGKNCIIQYMV